MPDRYIRKLISWFAAVLLMLPQPLCVFAADISAEDNPAAPVQADDLAEYIDATDAAEYDDPVFGTCRIKVKAELDSLEGAAEGVSYGGATLLRYGSSGAAKAAYYRLVKKYGDRNVVVDLPVMKAESASAPVCWGTKFMNLDDESLRVQKTQGSSAEKVTVAVIDSGITAGHEIFGGTSISPDSRSLLGESDTIRDEDGHGTSVAGIIAESTPVNTELMILKTYTDGERISIETVNQAIAYAADKGADVINLSMATSVSNISGQYAELVNKSIREMEEQLEYAAGKGIIVCASSGNDGGDMDSLGTYPACSSHTISVGSVDNSGKRSYFSNYGSALDFCAPGENLIVAAYDTDASYYTVLNPDNCSGTSFAAPYIAACCCFVKMERPGADIEYAKEKLRAAAVDYGDPGWDKYYGWGMPKYEEFDAAKYDAEQAAKKAAEEKADADAKAAAEQAAKKAKAAKVTSVTVNTKTVNAKAVRSAIAKKGGSLKTVTRIVLGSKVKKISKNAFRGTNVKILVVKSKRLTKKSVKASLKGSRVSKVKVSIFKNTKKNRTYVKKYKKIFTKKNAGRKISIR